MKRAYPVTIFGTVLLASALYCQATDPQHSTRQSEQELRDLENHWLEVENDPKELDAILASDFLHVVPRGIITKTEQIEFMRRHPSPGNAPKRNFEDLHVRVYGNVGIVNGIVAEITDAGTRKTLFTDVFAYRDGKWQAVSAQELPAAESTK